MLPLGKLHIWEVATWEIVTWDVAFGKIFNTRCDILRDDCLLILTEMPLLNKIDQEKNRNLIRNERN